MAVSITRELPTALLRTSAEVLLRAKYISSYSSSDILRGGGGLFLHKVSFKYPHKVSTGVEVGRIWWPELRVDVISTHAIVKMFIEGPKMAFHVLGLAPRCWNNASWN
jgi:hypothetical protein